MKLRRLSKEGEAVLTELLEHSAADADFKLMTTLRYDPNLKHLTRRVPIAMEDSDEDVFFLSKLHNQRLKYGAKLLGWDIHISHTEMVNKMLEATHGHPIPLRVRVTVDKHGVMECEANEIPLRDNLFSGLSITPKKDESDPFYEVVLDDERVGPQVTNMIKTTNRQLYDAIRQRRVTGTPHPREAILVGPGGELLEGTMTSVAVDVNGEWITPNLVKGGMVGVTRSFLLELGFVKEGTILASDLKDGTRVLVSNGVQGVCAGVLRKDNSPAGRN